MTVVDSAVIRMSRASAGQEPDSGGQAMTITARDLRFEPLVAEIRPLLEEYGYRLPPGDDHIRELVLARVGIALKNLVEIFEGRTW